MPENESIGLSIGVQRGVWVDLHPDVAVMVAPPVTVTATPAPRPMHPYRKAQLSRSRGNMPVARHRKHAG